MRLIFHGFAKRMPMIWICHSIAIPHPDLFCDASRACLREALWLAIRLRGLVRKLQRRLLSQRVRKRHAPQRLSGQALRSLSYSPPGGEIARGPRRAGGRHRRGGFAGRHGCNGRQWVLLRPLRHREAIFRGCGVLHEDVPAEFPNAKDMAPDEVSRVMNMIAGSSSGPPGLSQDAERDVAFAAWVDVRGQRCHVFASAAEARKLGANVAANGAKLARHARGGRQRSGQRARPETQPDSPSDNSETRRPLGMSLSDIRTLGNEAP